ncbi:MAG: hypothetical protein KDA24_20100 [Deltaproteobacteria bacterium]|nr:hypothetical protein [Deltaproteobacteria bacterium]
MSLSPDLLDLLARYPDELTDAELETLRNAAKADPRLDEAMHEVLHIDAALDGVPDITPTLSELGERRLRKALSAEAPKAWGSPPAAPLEAKADNVVSLFGRRPVQLAIAAIVLVAVGLFATTLQDPANDPYNGGIKGGDFTLEGQLIIQAKGGSPLVRDEDAPPAHPSDQPVRITARLENRASIALLEIQGDVSAVVWPLPGATWSGVVGLNVLQPPGSSPDYRPARPGAATYILLAREEPLAIPARRISFEDLVDANPGVRAMKPFTIDWTRPTSGSP